MLAEIAGDGGYLITTTDENGWERTRSSPRHLRRRDERPSLRPCLYRLCRRPRRDGFCRTGLLHAGRRLKGGAEADWVNRLFTMGCHDDPMRHTDAFAEARLPFLDAEPVVPAPDEATEAARLAGPLPSYIKDHRARLRQRFMTGGARPCRTTRCWNWSCSARSRGRT